MTESLSGGSATGAGGENENVNLMETLDLVCKDEKEWTMWTQALTGLHDGTIPVRGPIICAASIFNL